MKQYTDLLRRIQKEGRLKENRTGVNTISLLGPQMEFDLSQGFPLEDLRPIFFRGVVAENLWFLAGTCNNEDLLKQDVKIWDKWALKEDWTKEVPRQLPDVVISYQDLRLSQLENRDELDEDQVKELRNSYVQELHLADERDNALGLPTIRDPKDAKSNDDLKGGVSLLREAGISLTETQLLLPKGYLGPIYGVLWRQWLDQQGQVIDQIQTMIDKLSSDNPKLRYSRANIVTAYQPGALPDETLGAEENIKNGKQALAACHTFFQLFAEPLTLQERLQLYYAARPELEDESDQPDMARLEEYTARLDECGVAKDQLTLKLYQRSADFPVGVPFNIAGYAMLTMMFAKQLNMKPAKFIHSFGDAHIYVDQLDGVEELLARADDPANQDRPLPTLEIADGVASIFDYKPEDFTLVGYNPIKPQIAFPVAV